MENISLPNIQTNWCFPQKIPNEEKKQIKILQELLIGLTLHSFPQSQVVTAAAVGKRYPDQYFPFHALQKRINHLFKRKPISAERGFSFLQAPESAILVFLHRLSSHKKSLIQCFLIRLALTSDLFPPVWWPIDQVWTWLWATSTYKPNERLRRCTCEIFIKDVHLEMILIDVTCGWFWSSER